MEIERKFLIDRFPDEFPLLHRSILRQGYLCTRPAVRIRSTEQEGKWAYKLCIKGKGTLVREEVELDLTEDVFRRLSSLLDAPFIEKELRVYALPGGEKLECNLVDHRFWYAEVEFPTVDAARAFTPPPFLGREVTEDPGFSMAAYWEKRTF